MAYEIARGVLEQYPIMQRIELRLIHFSRGLESKNEAEDNHVVNLVLQRLVEEALQVDQSGGAKLSAVGP